MALVRLRLLKGIKHYYFLGGIMPKLQFVIVAAVLSLSSVASAATVDAVNGKVLINRGDGFQPATSGTQAKAGDLLMANAGGSAKLVYPGGCQVSIIPGRVVSVGNQPPCTAPYLAGLEPVPPESTFWSTPVPFAIGCSHRVWHLLRCRILPGRQRRRRRKTR